jgi:hypothetical protein
MERRARVPIVGALCAATGLAQPVEPALPDVLRRTVAYVERFHTEFASIIADEQYEQEVFRSRVAMPDTYGLRAPLRRRSLLSEFVLVFVPTARAWLGFRDVIRVDGKPVKDRNERLARLLIRRQQHTEAELKTIADESARFNIGDIQRNTNQPLLVLLFFDASHQRRFTFERGGDRRIDGVNTWAIRYLEQVSPTIIRTADERSLYSEGTAWIDPATGRILRTHHQVEDREADLRTTMEVRFRSDPRFGVDVPVEMTEEYAHIVPRLGVYTRCRARYSNFRRFEVESKLIVPK